MSDIAKKIEFISRKIKEASSGNYVSIVAVTKTFDAYCIESAVSAGIKDIGESKIQEALPKFETLSNKGVLKNVKKHFIGNLQSNKAKKAVLNFDLIQSLHSKTLAADINRHAKDAGKIQDCLLELKISQEITKHGISEQHIDDLYGYCTESCANIRLCGIMTVAPYFEDKESARPYFKKACKIFTDLKNRFLSKDFLILSMGMSDDFEIAVQEGANMVRIGSALFGERIYDK